MRSDAKNGDLLYVSNQGPPNVLVFTYPRARLVGELAGFGRPYGLCVDQAQDVWVVSEFNSGTFQISEYTHGARKPLRVLDESYAPEIGCAIEPNTGNLAVVNPGGSVGSSAGIIFYDFAAGDVLQYSDASMPFVSSAAYDGAGNLFVTGNTSKNAPMLAELPHGATQFINFPLQKYMANAADGVLWDGTYVVVAEQVGGTSAELHRFSVSGSRLEQKDKSDIFLEYDTGLFLTGGRIIGGEYADGYVYFWNYPDGVDPTKIIKEGVSGPSAAAVSLASSGFRSVQRTLDHR